MGACLFTKQNMDLDLSYDFVDNYDHIEENLEYILENVLSEDIAEKIDYSDQSRQLHELFNTLLLNKCECKRNKNDRSKCSHGSNYVWNEEFLELVLRDNIPDLIYECSNMCTCTKSGKCLNRLVQCGPRKGLKIIHSVRYYSKGLVTTRDIPKGAFICEYAGELLTTQQAKNIISENELDHKMNYVLFLKESCVSTASSRKNVHGDVLTIVDPTKKGNIGRYLNHSCEPNCQIISVRIDSPIPKIAFFSRRYIKAGEEITFNYNEGVMRNNEENISTKRIPCLCGSKNCMKYLPNSE